MKSPLNHPRDNFSGNSLQSASLCRRLALLLFFVTCQVAQVHAGNPLGLTPGTTAKDVRMGPCTNLAAFNTNLNATWIGYNNASLDVGSFNYGTKGAVTSGLYYVRLPKGFDPNSTNQYGLITYIPFNDSSGICPPAFAAGLDAHNVICVGGEYIGNNIYTYYRYQAAIMASFRMCELYNIDRNRIYVSGLSGGAYSASALAYLRPDWYHGVIPWCGSDISQNIPGTDWGAPVGATGGSPVAPPAYFRTTEMTHYSDQNRLAATYVFRYGRLNFGVSSREILRPGAHSADDPPGFVDSLDFMYHPLVDSIWDRFEDGFPGGNVQAGKVVAGTGWSAISGAVSEGPYVYNGATNGVLWLKGDGAAALSKDTFTWNTNYGIHLDARLRAELAGGQNQQIGLHVVPSSFTSGTASNRPGFHLYWCYGQPYRAELVGADGTNKLLATWQFTNPPPMNLSSSDVTFWDSESAPDYAGRMQAFRGEDVRLHLSSVGFQLTFNRSIATMSTTYTSSNGVVACPDTLPIILQGFWSDVESNLVSALPAGTWRLVLSNNGLVSGQPVGNAVVDEIHLVGCTGQQAAPAPVAATAPTSGRLFSWGQIAGAMGYIVQRSDSPDGPFTTVSTLVNTNASYADTNATQTRAYYYRVAAVGSDGATGLWSSVASAAVTPGLPAAPTFPGCTLLATNQAQLAWMDNANNETGYRVERSPAGMGQWTLSGTLAANSTSFTDTNLTAATAYDYRVSAVGDNGISGYATLTLTTPAAISGAVATPTGLTATNAANNSVALSWNAAAGNACNVKRGVSASGPFATIAAGLTGVTYTDPLLPPGTYYYVVSGVSGPAESTNSAPVSIAVTDTLPPAITVPGTINGIATSAIGAVVTFATSATDAVSGACTATNLPPSGSLFPVGTNVVTVTAADASGNIATSSFLIVVQPFGTTAASGFWNADASGVWSNAVYWSSGLVPGAGGAAYFDSVSLTADRTVYLAAGIALNTLSFGDTDPASSASWTLDNNGNAGNALSLIGSSPAINVNALGAGAEATINANVSGSSGLTKSGSGQLILPLPTYTGNTTVSGGTLTLSGGSYSSTNFNLGSGATLEFYLSGYTLDGPGTVFSGTGTLLKTGPGTLKWGSAATTFALGAGSRIDVQNGTFTGGSSGNEVWTNNLSDLNVSGFGVFDGVEANVCVNALTGNGIVKSGFSGSGYAAFTFGVNNGSGAFYGQLADSTGTGSFIKTGTGTQVLAGICTYTGSTTIAGGTLQIGDGTTDGSISNSSGITNNGALVYNLAGSQSYTKAISGTGSLSKTGAGMLTLSGPNNYTGDTTINGGSLVLTRASLSGSAGVNIATGCVISLNFTGTNAVRSFRINGVAQSAGTWGGTASSATYKTALIAGTGILNVTSGPASLPYDSWAASYNLDGTPGMKSGLTGDPDSDGLANLIEYATGQNPTVSSVNPITFSRVGVNVSTYLQLSVSRNPAATDILIEGLSAGTLTDPGAWSTNTTVTVTNTPSVFTVRDSKPMESNIKRFLKLRFTLMP